MGEDEAFLRAIRAQPTDDTTRLVYADWLDERGDPRGEYLRAWFQLEDAVRKLAALRPSLDPAWVGAVTGRVAVLLRPAGHVPVMDVRRGTVIVGQDGRFVEAIDREVSLPGHAPWLHLQLRDVVSGDTAWVRYRPADEVEVVRVLSEFEWERA
jgi:uncharacterized protein (TIGR02996 family)